MLFSKSLVSSSFWYWSGYNALWTINDCSVMPFKWLLLHFFLSCQGSDYWLECNECITHRMFHLNSTNHYRNLRFCIWLARFFMWSCMLKRILFSLGESHTVFNDLLYNTFLQFLLLIYFIFYFQIWIIN